MVKNILLQLKRIVAISTIALSALGIAIITIFYDNFSKLLPVSTFYLLIFLLLALFFSDLIYCLPLRKNNAKKDELSGPIISTFYANLLLLCFIGGYITSLFFDIAINHSMFYSGIMLIVGMVVSALLTKHSYRSAIFLVLFLFLSYIVAIYAFYPPSLGIDTWRDISAAATTVKTGSMGNVSNEAYQIPIVTILYSSLSLILGISPIYASSVVGMLYILMTIVLAFIISNKLCGNISSFPSFMTVMLVMSVPVIAVWSVAFIPQAFSFLMFLSFLTLVFSIKSCMARDVLMALPFFLIIAISHGGVALWTIGFFTSLIVIIRIVGGKHNGGAYLLIKRTLPILSLLTIVYFVYTTVMGVMALGIQHIFTVFTTFFEFNSNSLAFNATPPNSNPLATALFTYGALAISVTICFIAWLENKRHHDFIGVFIEVVFIYGILMLAIGFLGPILLPSAVLDRYLGFGSLLLLSIVAAKGFVILLKRGLTGKIFVAISSVLLIMCIGFGAVLAPSFNPFNANSNYSIQCPPNWSEASSTDTIVSYVYNGKILTDYRTGLIMSYPFIYHYSGRTLFSGIEVHTPQGIVTINYLGPSSTTYEKMVVALRNGEIFVFRSGSFNALSALVNSTESYMYPKLLNEFNQVYSGSTITVIMS